MSGPSRYSQILKGAARWWILMDRIFSKAWGCATEDLLHAAAAQGHRADVSFEPTEGVTIQLERSPSARATDLMQYRDANVPRPSTTAARLPAKN